MPGRRYLIITSDDYGYSSERDDGIINCFREGAITGAVLMVNGVSAVSGVAKAKQAGMPLDLHLNLSEGSPIGSGPYKTLLDKDGFFLGMNGFREAQKQGLVDMQEVRVEIQAQIDKFEEMTGSKPAKVDGHQHVHVIPGVAEVFADVLNKNDIRLTRLPIELEVEGHPYALKWLGDALRLVVDETLEVQPVFDKYNIGYPLFTGMRTMGLEMTIDMLQTSIRQALGLDKSTSTTPDIMACTNVSKATLKLKGTGETKQTDEDMFCELMVHPGNRTGKVGGVGNGPDDFSQSPDREHEMAIVTSEDMKQFYVKENINLIPFYDIEVVCK